MRILFLSALLLVCACADQMLHETNETKSASQLHSMTLQGLAGRSATLSSEYVRIARLSTKSQDFATGLVMVGAGAVAFGGVTGVSAQTLSRYGLAAVSTEIVSRRYVPKKAIKALYLGAKRMNCVTMVSAMGQSLGLNENGIAKAVTAGSILQIQLMTQEGLVREVGDYSAFLTEFTEVIRTDPNKEADASRDVSKEEIDYIKLIKGCTSANAEIPTPS